MIMPCQIIKTAQVAAQAATPGARLPEAVKDALLTALDDEYHAEATYAGVMARHGDVRPFSHIIKAERRHAAAIKTVLKAYGVEVPGNGYLSGDLRLEPVADTLGEACATGVTAEVENVRLYDEELIPTVAGFDAIAALFAQLRDSSRDRHLPAFRRCATRGGGAPDLHSQAHGGCGKGRRRGVSKGH
jgi:hypothetical protein